VLSTIIRGLFAGSIASLFMGGRTANDLFIAVLFGILASIGAGAISRAEGWDQKAKPVWLYAAEVIASIVPAIMLAFLGGL
jgi:uncharacterized membrane protein YeaQ/YmgE (transglycosylase-associated protein family)